MNELQEILSQLIEFRDDRNWKQFHTPSNLVKSISIEANELLENYQWGDEHANIKNIKEEVADIFGYLLLYCYEMNIDLIQVSKQKIELNKKKYPINKSYGSSKKYDQF